VINLEISKEFLNSLVNELFSIVGYQSLGDFESEHNVTKIVDTGSTLIHFVKWSMPTRRNFTCPFTKEKVQEYLLPKFTKGHGAITLCNPSAGR